MISPFILSVAKCSVVFHYSPPYFAGFISDIIPPFSACSRSNTRRMGWSLQVQIPYVHCLLAWFPIYIVLFVFSACSFFLFVCLQCDDWVLSGFEGWVHIHRVFASPPDAVSRPGKQLKWLMLSLWIWMPPHSTLKLCDRLHNLGFISLSVNIEAVTLHS